MIWPRCTAPRVPEDDERLMLSIEVAGIGFQVHIAQPEWLEAAAERYAAFVVQEFASSDAQVWQVSVAADPDLLRGDAPWIDHEGPITTFHIGGYAARLDLQAQRAEARFAGAAHANNGLDRVLSYICMQALPSTHDGLLLHAAGVIHGGEAFVFAGPSEAGKTTVARLATGWGEVMGDENLIIRVRDGRASAYSTPFWGGSTPHDLIHRINRCAPLRAVYMLEQAAGFTVELLTPAYAAMSLLATEKVSVERTNSAADWLHAAERLVSCTPVYRLGFQPTREIWRFLSQTSHLPH